MTGQFREKIGPLEGSCKGLQCFVVGSGPSLDDVNLASLKGKYILALNAAILKFTSVRSYPDAWWVWYDSRAYREMWERVTSGWNRIQCLTHKKGMEDMRGHKGGGRYIEYVKDEFRPERSVVETAILLAQFLGFSEVVLVGIDGMQGRDGEPYAKGLSKPCHFMQQGDQASCRRSSESMVQALDRLNERMAERGRVPRIIQTSELYPRRDQFEFLPFDEAVRSKREPTKQARARSKL